MSLSRKLKDLRKKMGLSQLELSEKLFVSRQAISSWESGASKPSTENLRYLSKLYDVPLEYLLNESEDELPATASAGPAEECGLEKQDVQEKRKLWIRRLVIAVVTLTLLVCCLFWYENRQKENDMDLHTIQSEDTTSLEVPEFNLGWG